MNTGSLALCSLGQQTFILRKKNAPQFGGAAQSYSVVNFSVTILLRCQHVDTR